MSEKPYYVNFKESTTRELRLEVPQAPMPCPFCPSIADDLEIRLEETFTRVFCRSCGAYGPYARNVTHAIEAWNYQSPTGWDERLFAIEGKTDNPPRVEKEND